MLNRTRKGQVVGLAMAAVAVSVFMWAKLRLVSGLPKTAYAEKEQPASNPPRPDPTLTDPSSPEPESHEPEK